MLRTLTIENYKSILDHSIDLGRINVFIGENGCGKTNILEAAAMAGAALTNKLSVEELWNRGMRVAKPALMRSSFAGAKGKEIVIECRFGVGQEAPEQSVKLRVRADESTRARVVWTAAGPPGEIVTAIDTTGMDPKKLAELLRESLLAPGENLLLQEAARRRALTALVGDFAIYNANVLALRGLHVISRRLPLGVYGENLHSAIAELEPETWAGILERAKCISWVENIVVDPADKLKHEGHKLLQSDSTLYFHDRFMRRKNNVFSAENVNEGILHILFYLVLFASEGTPRVLGIDNIDTALNPQLCRELVGQLAELAAQHDKQALITTHNPAVLDGLNLHDDEQRLFVVSRNDDGHTVTKRIKLKPEVEGAPFKFKLSELWMRGHLGGLPERF